MSGSSSPGFDTVLPPFIKHICKLVPRHHVRGHEFHNVLAPCISQLFTLLLTTVRIPSSWKAAKLAPIYKNGAVTHPSNYQMLAVSNTPDCLYTNVFNHGAEVLLHGRNTLQPLFILRHLKHAAQTLQPQGSPRLYATFIDFEQAYDSIPRDRLCGHLRKCQMPSQLTYIIKDLYQDNKYILIDGDKF
eukprot:1161890-Pelagomonas_calceolata.AAC.1